MHVVARGDVRIGDGAAFVAGLVPISLVCEEAAELIIGAGSGFNYGASVRAARSVRIGARCMIASFVTIRDFDGARTEPVVVGDDVWIAHGAHVEPGVTIGDGSVISAGSVVWNDVPPRSIAIGNPATTMPIEAMRGANAFRRSSFKAHST